MGSSDLPGFDRHWASARQRLDSGFEQLFPEFFGGLPAEHLAAVRGVLQGGKCLRGCLVCLLNDAFGGAPAAAIPRAMAIECVQAASLIHDDLVDGDTSRRGRPATWTVLGARRAVLLGDLMFATALRRMTELGPDDGLALAQAIARVAAGAYQESLAASAPGEHAQLDAGSVYPRLIHLKTGVLFGAAAQVGALAAGVAAPLAARAFEYGARIGEAYQIADDLQDWLDPLPGQSPEAPQRSLLVPAVWHFCAEADPKGTLALATADGAERLRPLLRERMAAAIEGRVQQAIAAVDHLPGGPRTELLRTAPVAIVRAMSAGAP